MPNYTDIFSEFQSQINEEQEIREGISKTVKEIHKVSREIVSILQVVHHDESNISEACGKARALFEDVRQGYARLAATFPPEDYFKYRDQWKIVTQQLSFCAALIVWLEVGILISRETTAEILGIKNKEGSGFHLDIEDFLIGILELCSELARLAINCVTRGDYSKPMQISKFVLEVNAGFRLLNLKNDYLRKRFDGLKYDVKKIEEVVYDLSIRGLTPGSQKPQNA